MKKSESEKQLGQAILDYYEQAIEKITGRQIFVFALSDSEGLVANSLVADSLASRLLRGLACLYRYDRVDDQTICRNLKKRFKTGS